MPLPGTGHSVTRRQSPPPQLDEEILFKLATNPEAVQMVLDFFEKQKKNEKRVLEEERKRQIQRITQNNRRHQERLRELKQKQGKKVGGGGASHLQLR